MLELLRKNLEKLVKLEKNKNDEFIGKKINKTKILISWPDKIIM